MVKRGTTTQEVEKAIRKGKKSAAKKGRTQYEYSLIYDDFWGVKKYMMKKILAIVAEEEEFLEVVTVYTFYF